MVLLLPTVSRAALMMTPMRDTLMRKSFHLAASSHLAMMACLARTHWLSASRQLFVSRMEVILLRVTRHSQTL